MKRTILLLLFTLSPVYQAVGSNLYSIHDLGTLGGSSSWAEYITPNGIICGWSETDKGEVHGFLWDNGTMVDIGSLGVNSEAQGCNDSKQVVGRYQNNNNKSRSFLWKNGIITDIGTLGGDTSEAWGITESGVITGASRTNAGYENGYIYENGKMVSIGTLGGRSSVAYRMNNAHIVTGYSQTTSGDYHAFLYHDGSMIELGTLDGTSSNATDSNDFKQVSGSYRNSENLYHAYIWEHGVMQDIGTLGGSQSFAEGINNSKQVVGHSLTSGGIYHAYVWQNGIMTDLNSLINNSGWELARATYINDQGQIVGIGSINGEEHGYLLTPTDIDNSNDSPDKNPLTMSLSPIYELLLTKSINSNFLPACSITFDTISCNPDNGHYYKRIDIPMRWQEAKAYCENIGGYLATTTTSSENIFVYKQLVATSSRNCWLGATDTELEGTWAWITGEVWDFTDWRANEPNNDSGQDNLNMYTVGGWDDAGMPGWPDETLNFVCEWNDSVNIKTSTGYKLPFLNISVDGNTNDWSNIEPVFVDGKDDKDPGANFQGTDIKSFYLARDDQYLYMMIELYDGTPRTESTTVYQFQANQSEIESDTPGDYFVGAYTSPNLNDSFVLVNKRTATDHIHIAQYPSEYMAIGGNCIEWKAPLSVLGDLNNKYIRVYTHVLDQNAQGDLSFPVSDDQILNLYITDAPVIDDNQDCNGDIDGTAYLDNCQTCVGGNTGQTACTQDCNGDWGGSAVVDECGICGGDGSTCANTLTQGNWSGVSDQNLTYSFIVNGETAENFIYRIRLFCSGGGSVFVLANVGDVPIVNNSISLSLSNSSCTPGEPWNSKPLRFTGSFTNTNNFQGTYDYDGVQLGTWQAAPSN